MNKSNLSYNLWRNLIFLTIFIFIVGIFAVEYYDRNQNEKMIRNNQKENIQQLANSISFSTKINDRIEVDKTISSFELIKNARFVQVRTVDNYVLYNRGEGSCDKDFLVVSNINYLNNKIGILTVCLISNTGVIRSKSNLIFLFILFLGTVFLFIYFIIKHNTKPIYNFIAHIENIDLDNLKFPTSPSEEINNSLINELYLKVHKLISNLKVTRDELINKKNEEAKLLIAKQIAHDIRSPLEALKSIVGELDELDFSTKQIITNSVGRISDIANGLLKVGKEEQKEFAEGSFRILMDDLIGDKQFEYDRKIHFTAAIDYKNSYMLGNENALYRGISNVINNAVEASGENDKIDVRLCDGALGILLTIKDHGQGMTQDFIEKALAGGVTTKDKGNGLGLSFAKKTVEEHKGLFKVESEVGKGTTISIDLPKIPTPNWFTDEIMINEDAELIVCVDDDPSFLQLYKDKLHGFNVKTFSEKKIEEALAQTDAQFYFDYDLGQSYSGLDYIIDKGLAARATLVTSMHQDQQIQKRCEQFGIKILPKQVFNNAQIKSVAKTQTSHSKTFHILIDDDELMHMSWNMEAQKQGVSFKAFFTVEEFLNSAAQICKSSVIYIDSNLADGIKGEVESEKISKIGFSEIYLATGYAASDIQRPKWIKEVVGKRAQFK